MTFFSARPHFEDRQIVQRMGELVNLSGQTNFDLGGYNSYIYDSYDDFLNGVSGATFLSLPFSAATDPVSGWSNQTIFQPGIIRITPPHAVFFSGNTSIISGTTREDVTNYVATAFDSQGTVVWKPSAGGGGGVTGDVITIDPYFDAGSSTSITWDVSGNSTNYEITITGSTTLNLSNVRDGDYGSIWVEQGNSSGDTVTFGTVNGAAATHVVSNGGAGSPTLTTGLGSLDVLTFTHNGNNGKTGWSVGNDYT